MNKVTSLDGTEITYERIGSGPAVILVDGALCYRSFGPMSHLSGLLAPHFIVYTYDRRGRGDSSNSKPYALEREIEDLDALINMAGGSAFLFGISSGGCLALEAAIELGDKVEKLAIYEPPYNSDNATRKDWYEYLNQLAELLETGRNGDAVALFMRFVGTPADQIEGMRQAPVWPILEKVGPTLAYDAAAIGADRTVPIERAANLTSPALIMNGTSLPFMLETATALAKAIPHAQHRTLEGQTHDVNLEILAPVLVEFFKA